MEFEILRKLGLSEGEIKIYNALLNLGPSPLNKIHESTGIERRNIYDILNKLIERGLVIYINESRKRIFQISHPKKIISYIEEKENELLETKLEVEKKLTPLIKQFNLRRANISAEVYRGEEGIKAAWDDSLNYKDMRWIGSGRYLPIMYPNWFNYWNKKRLKSNIYWHNLMRHDLRGKTKPMQLETIKYLPEEFSNNPAVIGIYGNKVANFILGKELFAFVIESKELAENYRAYHKYLWDNVAKE